MMYTLTAKPNDDLEIWFVFVDGRPVTDWNRDNMSAIRLAVGNHRLTYQLHGKGGELEIDLAPTTSITTPPNSTWPYTAKVPKNRSGVQDAIYFDVV